uniref:Cysteine protease n=1 Tax=Rhabditophanes sp. KR3021 TaxID=114890 RepID=A0AC35TZY6_9BILA
MTCLGGSKSDNVSPGVGYGTIQRKLKARWYVIISVFLIILATIAAGGHICYADFEECKNILGLHATPNENLATTQTAISYSPSEWAHLKEAFENYLIYYKKHYSQNHIKYQRFMNFVDNMESMIKAERRNPSISFGINNFTDWSEEEMQSMLIKDDLIKVDANISGGTFEAPEDHFFSFEKTLDYKWEHDGLDNIVLPDQENYCASSSHLSAFRVQQMISRKDHHCRTNVQELFECFNKDTVCEGTAPYNVFEFMKEKGVSCGNAEPFICNDNTVKRYFVGHVLDAAGSAKNERHMLNLLKNGFPFTVSVTVPKEFFSYRSGIFEPTPQQCNQKPSFGKHVMVVVGYGSKNKTDYWLLQNTIKSIGYKNGFVRWKRGENVCGIADMPLSIVDPRVV